MNNTYGESRDDALHALAHLLTTAIPQAMSATQVARVLDCRDSLLISIRRQFRLATGEAGSGSLQLPAVEANPTAALGTVLGNLPRTGPGQAPTDVLLPRDQNPYVAWWQQAARSALLATDVLETTHAWRADSLATWTVVADAANAAVALPMLDTHLARLAHTAKDEQSATLLTHSASSGLGLTARLTAATAQQGILHAEVARLTRPHVGRITPRPLRGLADVAAGQHRVAQMLHQQGGLLPMRALSPLMRGQARIAAAIDDSASRLQPPHTPHRWLNSHQADTAAALASAARARVDALTQMVRSRKGVADVLSGGEPVVWQTAEVLRALQQRPHPRNSADAQRQLRELQELAARGDTVHKLLTHGILTAFATGDYLVPHPERNQLQWRPCTPDADPPLRDAAEALDRARRHVPLPRLFEVETTRAPAMAVRSSHGLLADAVAAQQPQRPPSPGMHVGQPLSL